MSLLTPKEKLDLAELIRLLDEAYDHYFEFGDGSCKMSEGYIELRLPNYFVRKTPFPDERRTVGIGVYSYVLGPSRMHDFDNIAHALETVKEWHEAEMGTTYCPKCECPTPGCWCDA